MDFDNISPEVMEKAKTCGSAEELIELAKSEGIELSDEQLQAIAGGTNSAWDDIRGKECPKDDPGDLYCNAYR